MNLVSDFEENWKRQIMEKKLKQVWVFGDFKVISYPIPIKNKKN